MTRHDDTVRLRHMLDHAREAAELVQDKSRGELDADCVLSLALVHLLESLGKQPAVCRTICECAIRRSPGRRLSVCGID